MILDLPPTPGLSAPVAERAAAAVSCAQAQGRTPQRLIVVDVSLPSSTPRLWAFDVEDPQHPILVLRDRVAHGRGSDPDGDGHAQVFGAAPGSTMTSLGLYQVAEPYWGKHGRAYRLDGLQDSTLTARLRSVVLHTATYVTSHWVGRSEGCPAVGADVLAQLERRGLTHTVLWIDGPGVTVCGGKTKGSD